ncbi:DsbA family protein [Paenibacillus abyssi]|uniref:Disulfide bond formation protein D n=1 Tax=Paenibacillus abyssi TaxID=1340531 RepID=A0A917CTX7_9BACL|nr:thioredoxin domain-containing protein [Paenibacillus abyssi]GGF98229.1 disulfide bond formation protein D [Paenibacillus abyssi]
MSKNKRSSKNLVIFTLVILVLFITLFALNQATKDTEENNDVIAFNGAPEITNQPTMGDPNAKVSIVEFGDFKCPACKAWGETIMPQLEKDYIDTGKVTFSYVNVLFHGEESTTGALAAESVLAQNPDAYWTFHHELFNAQPANQSHDDLWLTPEKVLELAQTYTPEVDLDKLKADVENQATMAQVNVDNQLVQDFNVQLTPSIMIGDVMVTDPFDYNKIKEIIDRQLAE